MISPSIAAHGTTQQNPANAFFHLLPVLDEEETLDPLGVLEDTSQEHREVPNRGRLGTRAVHQGSGVLDGLFAALYSELRRIARRESRRRQSHAIMSTTTLVHEAYLDVSRRHALSFPDDQHFVGYVARAMRGLLIDRLRERMAQKRGGDLDIESLDASIEYMVQQPERIDQIDHVMEELTQLDPELARVVDLRYLCGFSVAEVAALLNTSERTIHRRWEKARALLKMALSEPDGR